MPTFISSPVLDIPSDLRRLQAEAETLVAESIGPAADEVDLKAQWPREGLQALASHRLT